MHIEFYAGGIVRRIDDLGRGVIPKEIRRTMRIREGEKSTNSYKFQTNAPILLEVYALLRLCSDADISFGQWYKNSQAITKKAADILCRFYFGFRR